ncbi:MAG: DUF58 domain-containing protein [Syntrophobacteraceae bacterium]
MTVLIGFSAVNTGNNLVYIVASALLSYMLVSGIFGRRNILGIDAVLEFPEDVFAGADVPVRVRLVNNRKFMPAFLVKIHAGGREAFFPFTGVRSQCSDYVVMQFPNRGIHHIPVLYISSVFPFNFFTRYRRISRETSVVVFPKPVGCSMPAAEDAQNPSKGEISTNTPGYESDLISIRDYVPGDPPKYINWKSTAKTGMLKTKELSAIELRQVLIDFDRLDKKDLERTISRVAFIVLKLLRAKVPVGLKIEGETFRPGLSPAHKNTMLTKLALYGQDQ